MSDQEKPDLESSEKKEISSKSPAIPAESNNMKQQTAKNQHDENSGADGDNKNLVKIFTNPKKSFSSNSINQSFQNSNEEDKNKKEDRKNMLPNNLSQSSNSISDTSTSMDVDEEDEQGSNDSEDSDNGDGDKDGKGRGLTDMLFGLFGCKRSTPTKCKRKPRKPKSRRRIKYGAVKAATISRRRKKRSCPANRSKRANCCPARMRLKRKVC